MRTILTYSLFSTGLNVRKPASLYMDSIVRNSEIRNSFMPEAEMVVHHDNSIPHDVLGKLESNGVVLKHHPRSRGWGGTFWRIYEFQRADDDTIVILQDADSPMDIENGIVRKSIDMLSGGSYVAAVHHGKVSTEKIIKDGKWIMACQCQVRMKLYVELETLGRRFLDVCNQYDADELFLAKYLWDVIKDGCFFTIERRVLPIFDALRSFKSSPGWFRDDGEYSRRMISNLTEK